MRGDCVKICQELTRQARASACCNSCSEPSADRFKLTGKTTRMLRKNWTLREQGLQFGCHPTLQQEAPIIGSPSYKL